MSTRVKLVAPWWGNLTEEEKNVSLEKEKGGVGATGYGVYLEDERIGYVYSLKDEKTTHWCVQLLDDREFSDRFSAVRALLQMHLARQVA